MTAPAPRPATGNVVDLTVVRHQPPPPFTEAELDLLGRLLREDRLRVRARGHDWDVADIRAVVADWGRLLNAGGAA